VASTFCGTVVDSFHPNASFVNLAPGTAPVSIDVTNTDFALFSMQYGDAYAHAFGPNDFFLLDIAGYDGPNGTGNLVGDIPFYLAANGTIVTTWQAVDLSSLAGAQSLVFGLRSSDNDPEFGLNTPASFAVDDLTTRVTPEPASWLLIAVGAVGCGLARWRRRAKGHAATTMA
jgi:hypothetical protein